MFMPNETEFTVPAETNYWAAKANSHWAVEIKQGVPNRKYSVSYLADGVEYNWSYTTPSSAYNGVLNTSDIPANDPEYQKKVNDRVNAYNSAVTQWITTAAYQTRPSYIVNQLRAYGLDAPLVAVGSAVFGGTSYIVENTIVVVNTNGRTANPNADDGGDGSCVQVTGSTVSSLDKLTSTHYYGKVVRIKPQRGDQSFYMKAVTADGTHSGAICDIS